MSTRALIFDCDGVLADTEKDGHRVAFNRTFEEHGVPLHWSIADYGPLLTVGGGKERIRAALTPDLLERAELPTDAAKLDELVLAWHRRKSELYRQIVADGRLPGRPGVARLAAEAMAAGWRIAVASTSAYESVRAVARHVFAPDVADQLQIFAGDVVSKKKPAPDIYLTAALELGVRAADCVAIEDSPIGCTSAVEAGMVCVVTESEYTGGDVFQGASLVVSDLGDPDGAPSVVRADPSGLEIGHEVRFEHLRRLLERKHGTTSKGQTE
ncbi:HAD-IA family hydrolase [Spirillospora sp. NPDC048819]|uniref:HAD-IA family hydrolase n=1 Tax=Spirillospora sp. NPDC048819 TaxID=3155268 RepID=UPI0033FB5781